MESSRQQQQQQRNDKKIRRILTARNKSNARKNPSSSLFINPITASKRNIKYAASATAARLNRSLEDDEMTLNKKKHFSTRNKQLTLGPRKSSPLIVIVDFAICFLLLATIAAYFATVDAAVPSTAGLVNNQQQQQQQQENSIANSNGEQQDSQQRSTAAALEAELNAILEQHEPQDLNSRLLSQEIISRLMIGNLTDGGAGEELDGGSSAAGLANALENINEASSSSGDENELARIYSGPDAMRLKKLFSFLSNSELVGGGGLNNGQVFSQFPVLPASQAATIKRASSKISNLLRQQQVRQMNNNNYARNTYDFGLGKRPDASVSSNILRFGDSSIGSGHVQSVSGQLGKRPAHRYDFGLGKRVASPTYPRYDFGLGKRAPNRIRYDFGLGKK